MGSEKLGANRIEVEREGNSLQLAGVRVTEHDATPVMKEITAEISPGEHVLIEGKRRSATSSFSPLPGFGHGAPEK